MGTYEFLADCERRGRSDKTIAAYRVALRHAEDGLGTLETATWRDIDRWLVSEKSHSGKTQRLWLAALSAYYEWQRMAQGREDNPVRDLPRACRPRVEPHHEHILTWPEVQAILRVGAVHGRLLTLQERTMLHILVYTGVRVSEAGALRREDIDLPHAVLWIRHGKGGKSREIALVPDLHQILTTYLNALDGDVLFDFTRPRRWAHGLVRAVGEAAGLHGVHPHSFRHALATRLIACGQSHKAVQQLLGHSSVKITLDTYVEATTEMVRGALLAAV